MGMVERISLICDEQNITIKHLEKCLNMGNGTIRKWNASYPSCDRALKVANFLHVSFEWLVTGNITQKEVLNNKEINLIEAYKKLPTEFKSKIDNFIEISTYESSNINFDNSLLKDESIYTSKYSVPVLGYSAAGSPITAIENALTFIETDIPDINFSLYIKGDSMEPLINNGDSVLIRKTSFIENGEIGIIQIGEDVTCKKFYDYPDRVELHSINSKYDNFVYQKDSLTDVKIIGKVILTNH